jgi:hypothetical protein
MFSIDAALTDQNLLGAALGKPDSWANWLTCLRAAFCIPLTEQERATFKAIAGDRAPPTAPVRELWCVAGRRSGKSRMAAVIAVYQSCFIKHKLARGETGYVLVLSPTVAQSRTVFNYIRGFLESSAILRQKIRDLTATEIRLTNNVVISAHPCSYKSVRGRTLVGCVLDEVAFFRDESSSLPDIETYRAVLPALTSNAALVAISTPYRRTGLLHQKHRDCFGQDDPNVLVVQGPTLLFNPEFDRTIIARAQADDPASASAEWSAEFRVDLSQYLDDATIDAAVNHSRPLELPPQPATKYFAFVDASAGRHDHFTFAIGHREGDQFVCDVLRGAKPPFDPASVAKEFAELAKTYHVATVVGDNYAGQWVASAFQKCGVDYRRATKPRSALYLESMPHFMRGAVSIPDHSRVLRELRLLERRTSPSGKDSIDHGKGGSDDYANSPCGCIAITLKESAVDHSLMCGGKLFSLDTGAVLLDATPWAARTPKPAAPEIELPPEAAARLEKFKEDYRKQNSLFTVLGPKLFGGGR